MTYINIKEFEVCLNCWKKLFILDDMIYCKIVQFLKHPECFPITPELTYAYLIRFLELWGVRGATNIEPEELSAKINELKPSIDRLEPLLKLDLNAHAEDIKRVFNELESVNHIGPTSVSKILHLLKPETFVMWDKEIAEDYKVAQDQDGYVEFLKKMKDDLIQLLDIYSKECGWGNPEEKLSSKYEKPLTKLIDEYNWLKTKKNDWAC